MLVMDRGSRNLIFWIFPQTLCFQRPPTDCGPNWFHNRITDTNFISPHEYVNIECFQLPKNESFYVLISLEKTLSLDTWWNISPKPYGEIWWNRGYSQMWCNWKQCPALPCLLQFANLVKLGALPWLLWHGSFCPNFPTWLNSNSRLLRQDCRGHPGRHGSPRKSINTPPADQKISELSQLSKEKQQKTATISRLI